MASLGKSVVFSAFNTVNCDEPFLPLLRAISDALGVRTEDKRTIDDAVVFLAFDPVNNRAPFISASRGISDALRVGAEDKRVNVDAEGRRPAGVAAARRAPAVAPPAARFGEKRAYIARFKR